MATRKIETPLRPLVVLVFLPGLYLVLLATGALSILGAIFGVKLGIAVAGRSPWVGISIVISCGLAGGAGVLSAVRATIESTKKGSERVSALSLRRSDAAGIWTSISKISRHLRIAPPDNLILAFGPDIFVMDGLIHGYDSTLKGRTLCISAPLLRILTVEEFEGVLAHEMAHFTGNDTLYSHYFYPVYQGSTRALRDMQEQAGEGRWHQLILILPMLLVIGYLNLFARIEKRISRIRELRADAIAGELIGRETVVRALAKVHAYNPLWPVTNFWMVQWLKENNAFANVPAFFVESSQRNRPALVRSLKAAAQLAHPLNSHPSFAERALALGSTRLEPDFGANGPLAATLLPELERFEERLTELRTLEIMKSRPGHFFTKRKQPPLELMRLDIQVVP